MITENLKSKIQQVFQSIGIDKVFFDSEYFTNVQADNLEAGWQKNEFRKENCFVQISPYVETTVNNVYGEAHLITTLPLWFCCPIMPEDDLNQREEFKISIRSKMLNDIILPFIKAYNSSGLFNSLSSYQITSSLSLFDDREICVIVTIRAEYLNC